MLVTSARCRLDVYKRQAEISLLDVGELRAEFVRRLVEVRLVAYMVGALIGAVDRVEPCPYVGVGGDGTQLPQAVRRSVERGDRNREWVQVLSLIHILSNRSEQ